MIYILDCSIVAAWILPDETASVALSLLDKLGSQDELLVPGLLWIELANVLNVSIKRKRLARAKANEVLTFIDHLPIKTDVKTGALYQKKLIDICTEYDLSSYDAAYLELAIRNQAVLVTLDQKLLNAAKQATGLDMP